MKDTLSFEDMDFTEAVEIPKEEKRDLALEVRKENLPPTLSENIIATFTPYLAYLKTAETELRKLNAENPTPEDSAKAREIRLTLVKQARKPAEKAKDAGKKDLLAMGRAIQAAYNLVETSSKLIEGQAEAIENFQEKKLDAERRTLIEPYMDGQPHQSWGKMSDSEFQDSLDMRKMLKERREKEVADKIEADKKEAEERERMKTENAKLVKEAEERDARERESKAAADAAIKAEREAREKAERELKAKQDAEDAEKKRIAADERKAKRAPDKTKLIELAESLSCFPFPEVKSEEAQAVLRSATTQLTTLVSILRDGAAKL